MRGRNFNLRAYLAGGGATLALIAAAVLVFASLGAYVAFEGLPIGNDGDDAAQVAVEGTEAAANVRTPGGSQRGGAGTDAPGARGVGKGGDGQGDSNPAGGGAVDLGVSSAPPATPDGADTGSGAAPQPVEPAPEPNPSGQGGGGGASGGPVAEVGSTIGDVTGLPVGELPGGITEPLGDTPEGSGALGDGLAGGQLGG